MKKGIIQRIKEKSKKRSNGCIEWTGTCYPAGYGNVYFINKSWEVHRLVWLLYRGEIPQLKKSHHGYCICHKCDNRKCINPDHLFLGTQLDNVADMDIKGRRVSLPGKLNPNARLNENDIKAIRELSKQGFSQRAIARKFSITHAHVGGIVRRTAWKNVK